MAQTKAITELNSNDVYHLHNMSGGGGGGKIMAIQVCSMARVFIFNGAKLPDPNPNMGAEDVRAFYAAQYPELATAALTGPEVLGDKMRYTFERAIGSKG